MTEVVSSDSGLGSDENLSDCEGWPPRDAIIADDDSYETMLAVENPRKVRKQRTKRKKAERLLSAVGTRDIYRSCDGGKRKQRDGGDDISAHSLMISNAKRAVERLSNLLADLRLICGLPFPRAIISDAASNEKSEENGNAADGVWRSMCSQGETFESRHDDDNADDLEWTTRLNGRKKRFSKKMKYFDAIGAPKAKRAKRRHAFVLRRYAACISTLIILLTLGLSSTSVNSRQPVYYQKSSLLQVVKRPVASDNCKLNDGKNAVSNVNALYGDVLLELSMPSKLRWRGDLELLQFAIEREMKRRLDYNRTYHVNSLLTESAISSTSNLSAVPFSPQAGPSSAASVGDPSLIDYEAIDVYWRRDIEQEKNPWYTNIQPLQSNPATNALPAEVEQFERDLQLLTEKSMTVQLNTREQRDYENLSKSYYTDFYLNVGGKAADKENNNDALFDLRPTSSGHSGCAAPFPMRIQPLPNEDHETPSTSKTTSSLPFCQWSPASDGAAASRSYLSGAEKTLVIEKRLSNADDRESSAVSLNAERRGDGVVLNDVSLADANTFEPLTGDVAEFFDFGQKDSDGSDIPRDDDKTTLVENTENVHDENSLALPFENLFDEGFIDTYFVADGFTLNELTLEVMREDPFEADDLANKLATEAVPQQSMQSVLQPPVIDEVDRTRYESVGTPSSGINSASSPSHGSSHEEFSMQSVEFGMESRFYNKLAPAGPTHFGEMRQSHRVDEVYVGDHDYYAHSLETTKYGCDHSDVRETTGLRRGRRSKDEQLAVEYGLPASADEITHMTHAQVQHILRNPQFTPAQKALVKKIRRRGRNKVAARKCRERRINPMSAGYEAGARSVRLPFDDTAPSTSQAAAMYAPLSESIYEDEEYFDDENFGQSHNRLEDFRGSYDAEEEHFFTNYSRDWHQFDNQQQYDNNSNKNFFP